MNIKIPAPFGLKTSFIALNNVDRVENCSLTFFEASAYNLYIIEKSDEGEEFFSLYTYPQKKDMVFAYNLILSLLKEKTRGAITLEMEAMKA